MKRKYFGTDGIRGTVGRPPMTPDFALKLGWAAGRVLARESGARVLIGKDTRRSGYMFESCLEAGLSAAGVEVGLLGPLPTPAVAFLTRKLKAQAGVAISASHNPHHDNGVKFFSAAGDKLSDAIEYEIEDWLTRDLECVAPEHLGMVRRVNDAQQHYVEFCLQTYAGKPLSGTKLVLDCANGAGYRVAPLVLRRLGAELITIGDVPTGFNINLDCGSTDMRSLSAAVLEHGADAGIALDGDADRCLMVDASGRVVDGDELLYVIASHRQRQGQLRGPVVGTLMSNLGLEQALALLGLDFRRAQVGDRYVLELMRLHGGNVGGETSGHTICLDRTTTGDGLVTALQVLAAMTEDQVPLSELTSAVRKCPQVLINVAVVGDATGILQCAELLRATSAMEAELRGRGRVLLRASGTEPLIRVMVESQDEQETRRAAEQLARVVRDASAALA